MANDATRICQMKVKIIETFNTPPDMIFTVIADIPHHVDWTDGPIQLVSLRDGPAKPGTSWEQNTDRLGKKLLTVNVCNVYEAKRKLGWKSDKPLPSQVTFLLEPDHDSTKLTWTVESEEVGIVQLAEPLLVRQTEEIIRKSLMHLKDLLVRSRPRDDNNRG